MRDKIIEYVKSNGLKIVDKNNSFKITFEKSKDTIIEITVLKDDSILEWNYDVIKKSNKEKIFSDWSEIYQTEHETKEELIDEYENDIINFIVCLYKYEFRIIDISGIKILNKEYLKTKTLQFHKGNEWKDWGKCINT